MDLSKVKVLGPQYGMSGRRDCCVDVNTCILLVKSLELIDKFRNEFLQTRYLDNDD